MQPFSNDPIMGSIGAVLPLAILLIESDEDRDFLSEMYLQYKALMYKAAIDFLGEGSAEVEEVVGAFVERMCKYCHTFQAVPPNKRASYVVLSVGNVCRDRLRELRRHSDACEERFDDEAIKQIPDEDDVHSIVFDRIYAVDLLNSLEKLSDRERELFLMRHIDRMTYDEMAAALHMKESSVRTALSRAKKHLEELGRAAKGGVPDDEA